MERESLPLRHLDRGFSAPLHRPNHVLKCQLERRQYLNLHPKLGAYLHFQGYGETESHREYCLRYNARKQPLL